MHPLPRSPRLRRSRRPHDMLSRRQDTIVIGDITVNLPLPPFTEGGEPTPPTTDPSPTDFPDPTTFIPSPASPSPSPTEDPEGSFTIPEGTTSIPGTITLDPPSSSSGTPQPAPSGPSSSSEPSSAPSSSDASSSEFSSFPSSSSAIPDTTSSSFTSSSTSSTSAVVTVTESTTSVSTTTEKEISTTTFIYVTTSGSSVWTATTTQFLAPSDGSNQPNASGFASNKSAIIGLSVGVAIVLIIAALLLFLCLARRRRRKAQREANRRMMEQRRRSTAHLRHEVDDDEDHVRPRVSLGPASATMLSHNIQNALDQSMGAKGAEANWSNDGYAAYGYKGGFYNFSSSHAGQSSSSLDQRSEGPSNQAHGPSSSVSHERQYAPGLAPNPGYVYDLSVSPVPILDTRLSPDPQALSYEGRPSLDRYRGRSSFSGEASSEDQHENSSNQSHVQFVLPPSSVARRLSNVDYSTKPKGLLTRLRGGAAKESYSSDSSDLTSPTASNPYLSHGNSVGSRFGNRSIVTPDLLRRNTSQRTGYTNYTTTEESAFPITPPAHEVLFAYHNGASLPVQPSSDQYQKAPPSAAVEVVQPSSLLNPPSRSSTMITTQPTVGPGPSRKRGGSMILDALPTFSYVPSYPPPLQESPVDAPVTPPRPAWMREQLGEPSPAISVHRDGLVDVDAGKERLQRALMVRMGSQFSLSGHYTRDSESIRDFVDYSRPVMLKDAARMYTSSSMATDEDTHQSYSVDIVDNHDPDGSYEAFPHR